MTIARTIGRIAVVLATVGALTALAGVAQAETSRPPGMSPVVAVALAQALLMRSIAGDLRQIMTSVSQIAARR